MRVLHILEATGGGTRRHILDLLPALQARGISSSLIYSPLRHPAFREDAAFLESTVCKTYEIAMGRSWQRAGDGKALRALYTHLKTHRYDLIHCHSSNAGVLGRFANALQARSTPVVYTPHYIAFAAGLPTAQRRAARWLEKILAPHTAHFIAVSRHEYSVLKRARLLKNNNASVIHNGIDASSFTHPSAVSPHPSPLVLGCFGRLTAQKNQRILIAALPRIAREFPDVQLRLFGEGEDENNLRALAAKLKVQSRVQWRGEVRQVQAEYSACDIIAQPSRWEGCSYALLEAAAAGRAIVASDVGGNPEVIAEAGVLLPAHDARNWAQNIIALAREADKRIALGKAATERVASQFRLETMVEKTIAVYERVLL